MDNDDVEKIKTAIRTGISGLWRFYDDGFTRWPRNQLSSLFSNIDLHHPDIRSEFQLLEKQQFIRVNKTEDCYLEVIKAPIELPLGNLF